MMDRLAEADLGPGGQRLRFESAVEGAGVGPRRTR